MDDEVFSFGQLITKTFKNIKIEDVEQSNNISNSWKKILFSIKGMKNSSRPANDYEGQNLYNHSRIIDLKNGVLLVEADHPGWIQLLQIHKKYILTGLKKDVPDLKINTIAFKLKGKKGELYNVEENKTSLEKVRTNIQKRIDYEEEKLSKVKNKDEENDNNRNVKIKEMPPELSSLFNDLKKSVLTNSKN